ncbi:hypothetical protein AGMMS49546_33550 [Spirochaetia bacterium]|nr:hypothetical protein AGMMS49546_33550 [Spirochaetia bacterium]
MRIFKTKAFERLIEDAGFTDAELITAAGEVNRGEYEADLGSGVYKKRIARFGAGKSGGYRFILYFRQDERLFFADMFAKSNQANIGPKVKRWYKKVAREYLGFTEDQLQARLKDGWIKEIVP